MQTTVKTAKMTIGVGYQSSHVYTESAEYTTSVSASASAVRVRRIHKTFPFNLHDYLQLLGIFFFKILTQTVQGN